MLRLGCGRGRECARESGSGWWQERKLEMGTIKMVRDVDVRVARKELIVQLTRQAGELYCSFFAGIQAYVILPGIKTV